MKEDRLPDELIRYFWDIDAINLSVNRYTVFIIERLLEYGNESGIRWIFHQYSKDEICNILKNSRRLSTRTAHFWAEILDIHKEEVLCLSKSFQKMCRVIWRQ
ncbi:MAG: hypothetical protein ACE5EA_09900 [Nitrospirota bacterium]